MARKFWPLPAQGPNQGKTLSGENGNKKAASPVPDNVQDNVQDKVQDKAKTPKTPAKAKPAGREIGGAPGPDPTRYGDWQHNGRCSDF